MAASIEAEAILTKPRPKVHGAGLTPYGMFCLAEEFQTAGALLNAEPRRLSFSDSPIRMLYYQALENYMRALLRLAGKEPEQIRAYMHDFGTMLEHCQAAGLVVRAKTAAFIKETRLDSDYVRVRYELKLEIPKERASQGTPSKELSRLVSATLEMHKKTRNALIRSGIPNP